MLFTRSPRGHEEKTCDLSSDSLLVSLTIVSSLVAAPCAVDAIPGTVAGGAGVLPFHHASSAEEVTVGVVVFLGTPLPGAGRTMDVVM